MKKSIYQVLSKMSEISLSGMSECFIGDVWEVESVARKYPLLVIDPHLKNHTYQNGLFKLKLDLYMVDLVLADQSNELEIVSDMAGYMVQYLNYLRDHDDEFGFYWRKDLTDSITIQSFTEKWADSVSGVKASIDISIPADGSLCKSIWT